MNFIKKKRFFKIFNHNSIGEEVGFKNEVIINKCVNVKSKIYKGYERGDKKKIVVDGFYNFSFNNVSNKWLINFV